MPKANDIVTIWCYNKKSTMTRKAAMAEFLEGMCACEGSEAERYTNIYCKLSEGYIECDDSDNWDGPRNKR